MATGTHLQDIDWTELDAEAVEEAVNDLEYHALMGVAGGDEPAHERPRPFDRTATETPEDDHEPHRSARFDEKTALM